MGQTNGPSESSKKILPLNMSSSNTANASPPWHAAYPSPKQANPPAIARQDVLELLRSGTKVAGKDCVLVDLRRNDHEVGVCGGDFALTLVLTELPSGRNHSRIHELACAKSVSDNTYYILCFQSCRHTQSYLVLL